MTQTKRIIDRFASLAVSAAPKSCRREAGARTILDTLEGFSALTEGQKRSAAKIAQVLAQGNEGKGTDRFSRRLHGESFDDFAARQLTGRYDV